MAAMNSSNRISVQEAADAIDEIMALDEDDQEALQDTLRLFFSSPRDQCRAHVEPEEDYFDDQGLYIIIKHIKVDTLNNNNTL